MNIKPSTVMQYTQQVLGQNISYADMNHNGVPDRFKNNHNQNKTELFTCDKDGTFVAYNVDKQTQTRIEQWAKALIDIKKIDPSMSDTLASVLADGAVQGSLKYYHVNPIEIYQTFEGRNLNETAKLDKNENYISDIHGNKVGLYDERGIHLVKDLSIKELREVLISVIPKYAELMKRPVGVN